MADKLGKLLISIDGQTHATNLTIEEDIDTATLGNGKIERKFVFKTGDTPSLPLSNEGTLNWMMFKCSSAVDRITATFNIDDGVLAPYTIVIPFTKHFLNRFGATFMTYITSVQFSTTSATNLEVIVRAYA